MSGTVYSSKSLMDSIGTVSKSEKEKSPAADVGAVRSINAEENNENTNGDNTEAGPEQFILASTVYKISSPLVPVEKSRYSSNENSPNTTSRDSQTQSDHEYTKDSPKHDAEIFISDSEVDDESDLEVTPGEQKKRASKTLEILKLLNPSTLLSSHELLLGSFFEEHKEQLVKNESLILRVITWNLNQLKPPNLSELSGAKGAEWSSLLYAGDSTTDGNTNKEGLADIYSVNFQETISLTSFSKSSSSIDDWCHFLVSVLNAVSSDTYEVVSKSGLLALTTIIIAKKKWNSSVNSELDGQIHDLKHETLGLGYLRWANKGCISTTFKLGGVNLGGGKLIGKSDISTESTASELGLHDFRDLDKTAGKLPGIDVQIMNVHLVHGEDSAQIQQRWDSWAKIQRVIGITDRSVRLVNSSISNKDDSQKRLEAKLARKLNKSYISDDEDELIGSHIRDDFSRTAYVPLKFSPSESAKFSSNKILMSDLTKLQEVTESKKVTIVCGDTNYRLSVPADDTLNTKNTIQKLVLNGRWSDLVSCDQLKREMELNRVFLGFKEDPINFAPTFKILNDSTSSWIDPKKKYQGDSLQEQMPTSTKRKPPPQQALELEKPYFVPQYDSKRVPAYTDRILYAERPFFKSVKGSYQAILSSGSDHLPVASTYELVAPIVDENLLHQLRSDFNNSWDEVINKFNFLNIETTADVTHNFESRISTTEDETLDFTAVSETIPINNGNIFCSAILGETLTINVEVENLVDEAINLSVEEQTNRGWFGTKISVSCNAIGENDTNKSQTSRCRISSRSRGNISFSLISTNIGILERTFIYEVPEFKECPAAKKYLALTIDIKDIFSTPLENISPEQFNNIQNCFAFIFSNSSVGLLNRVSDIGTTNDLRKCEWNLVREITLWNFDVEKYELMNKHGLENVKNGKKELFNFGSVTIFAFLYVWLKSQNADLNPKSERGRAVFSAVLDLINYFKLDAAKGYDIFGWFFADEYELEGYLEKDFNVKLQL